MRIGNTGRIHAPLAAAAMLLMSGCLSSTESPTSSDNDEGGDPGNNAPSISGNPQAAVMIGDSYSFLPSASDPDGDSLTFSVQNLPSWASFSSSSGRILGVPSLGDIGVYANITISVTDGTASTSLPGYSITVSQVELASITVSWIPPTENSDGSALQDLAGYRIYYGLSVGDYPNQVEIDTPGISTYVIENITPNTYYVVATAYNSAGTESTFSNVLMMTAN